MPCDEISDLVLSGGTPPYACRSDVWRHNEEILASHTARAASAGWLPARRSSLTTRHGEPSSPDIAPKGAPRSLVHYRRHDR
jgi:hypothetical protein